MISTHYLKDITLQFHNYKSMAENAVAQIDEEEFFITIDKESNSIAIIMKHMAGNMRSRWTDFLTTDGEKPDRNRDNEFVIYPEESKAKIMKQWETGWQYVYSAIESLTEEDLNRTVLIRGEPHSVIEAMNRQLSHCAYHIGQIVFLAKHFKSIHWQSLSIPRDKSEDFNKMMRNKNRE